MRRSKERCHVARMPGASTMNAEQRCGMDMNMTDERTFWRRQYHPLPAIPPYRGGRTNFESTKHGTHLGAAIRPRRGQKAKAQS